MEALRVRAGGSGRVVNWSAFKRGELIDGRSSAAITVVLTDAVSDLISECRRLDPECHLVVLSPNGFFKSSFDLRLEGRDFSVVCGRRLVRGMFPLNPLAAEFGRNFDVVVTVTSDSPDVERRLAEVLTRKYESSAAS